MPPRILKAPMAVWFSCFTQTSAPVRLASSGQACCGVGGTSGRTSPAVASSSARERMGTPASAFLLGVALAHGLGEHPHGDDRKHAEADDEPEEMTVADGTLPISDGGRHRQRNHRQCLDVAR